jgi:hypothetical protein
MDDTTKLDPLTELLFQKWVAQNQIHDVDHPDSHYDYRGFFLSGLPHKAGDHYPDTYKQHGHPTFSVESKYSRGLQDGGQWLGDTLIPPPMKSH